MRLVVQRKDLRQTHWADLPSPDLQDGQVRMRVDSFALTSNNITYAAFGDAMNYWAFYPTGDPASGCVPVWGFAEVAESRCDGVELGDRFYGYWPIGADATLTPTRVDAAGFSDDAPHRRGLPAVYNQYARCSSDPGYVAEREAQQALLRPLFATSFLIDDFLADNGFYGAHTVILSSASSKTAYGTAFCLSQRDDVKVVGLTSAANLDFVGSLGCYDDVISYDEISTALADEQAVYVDFSGSATVRSAVHQKLVDALAYSCAVGVTHWDSPQSSGELPGPAPVFFFAPTQAAKRVADWGPAGLQERLGAAWDAFMEPVAQAENPWLTVVHGRGRSAVDAAYHALLDGTASPREGHMLSLS